MRISKEQYERYPILKQLPLCPKCGNFHVYHYDYKWIDNRDAPGTTTFIDYWYCRKCDLEYIDERIYVWERDSHYTESEAIVKQLITDAFIAVKQLNPNL